MPRAARGITMPLGPPEAGKLGRAGVGAFFMPVEEFSRRRAAYSANLEAFRTASSKAASRSALVLGTRLTRERREESASRAHSFLGESSFAPFASLGPLAQSYSQPSPIGPMERQAAMTNRLRESLIGSAALASSAVPIKSDRTVRALPCGPTCRESSPASTSAAGALGTSSIAEYKERLRGLQGKRGPSDRSPPEQSNRASSPRARETLATPPSLPSRTGSSRTSGPSGASPLVGRPEGGSRSSSSSRQSAPTAQTASLLRSGSKGGGGSVGSHTEGSGAETSSAKELATAVEGLEHTDAPSRTDSKAGVDVGTSTDDRARTDGDLALSQLDPRPDAGPRGKRHPLSFREPRHHREEGLLGRLFQSAVEARGVAVSMDDLALCSEKARRAASRHQLEKSLDERVDEIVARSLRVRGERSHSRVRRRGRSPVDGPSRQGPHGEPAASTVTRSDPHSGERFAPRALRDLIPIPLRSSVLADYRDAYNSLSRTSKGVLMESGIC